ncbi:Arc family DNA-binding protein [Massilia sp. DWR3-1-1]|uniref:Arc family DNA-binding protein n=1 Tax=Massilia sp. DWR3-1-1 TaxID=2804559 RepID=UPI003CF672F4
MSNQSPAPASAKEQFILRFPCGMRDQLKNLAATNRRSMNAELLLLIEMGMGLSVGALPVCAGGQAFNEEGQSMA